MIYNFYSPTKPNTAKKFPFLFLLAVRIIFGVLLMNHGIQKWSNFQELSTAFPDPLGIGSPLSLGLAIFGELVLFNGFYHWLLISAGNDSDDFHNGDSFLCDSCE